MIHNQSNRREFLKATAAVAACTLLPATRAMSANGKLRTAHIGVGGMGAADLSSIASHPSVEVAALCDVDRRLLNEAQAAHRSAKVFRDFREIFAQMRDSIDAVVVSTPDHTHAAAAMTALNHNKPVYCQKPLTHDVFEARRLRLVAAEKGLPTQMGIQVHSAAPYRRAVQMIQSGTIGKVSRVHAWSNKNWGFDGKQLPAASQPPDDLEWDLWLGTAATRSHIPNFYHQANWRKLIEFGTGTLGDMGVHIFDTPYAALELTFPKRVKTTCRPPTGIGHPEKNIVEYEFPRTKYTTDSLQWTWYDGAFAPPKEDQVALQGVVLPDQGSLFVGEEGYLLLPHVDEAQLYPQKKFANVSRPEVPEGNHYHQWVDACLGDGKTSADFGYAGPLTEALLLGVVANRFPNSDLHWDPDQLQVTNMPDANKLLRRQYRSGFEVEGL